MKQTLRASIIAGAAVALTATSSAFCPALSRPSSVSSTPAEAGRARNDAALSHDASLRRRGDSTRWHGQQWQRQVRRQNRLLLLSGVGSTVAPPPTSTLAGRGGGGEDGMRELTREEGEAAVASFAASAKRQRKTPQEYNEYMEVLRGMQSWVRMGRKRVGCRRMVLGNFRRGQLLCIVAAEVVWSTGYMSRDVRLCSRLLVVNPMYDTRTIGFATVDELKSFGLQNALLLDLSPMMAVPSLRVFCLASTKTLDEDPERLFQDPLVQQYNSRVRRCCYILDDIPDWADLGPYWYEGVLPRGVRFFFRKKFHAAKEYEVTLQRPGAGLSTGSGTVGGARVIPMKEAEFAKDIPGHEKVREIERRLANRLLEEMQGENPVLTE